MASTPYRRRRGRPQSPDLAVYVRLMAEDNGKDLTRVKRNLARALREEVTQRQREVLYLYFARKMTMREIGQTLGVERSTVSRTIQRGEARLRRCLRYGAAFLLNDGEDESSLR